jgi:ankyrin repeat protein
MHEFLKHETVNVNAAGALGNTALMMAWFRGQLDMVSELLKFPTVDVHFKNKAGSTALDIAYGLELVEIARCLEEYTKK